jgi:hypothetical protein
MNILIKIDKETYGFIRNLDNLEEKDGIFPSISAFNTFVEAVREGKVITLPKGHGKCVDIGKIEEDRIDDDNPIIYLTINGEDIEAVSLDYLNNLPAIIEADEESEEEE